MKKEIVIKIGGSILYDNGLNVNFKFLRKFKDWYISSGGEYEIILVVVGGGKLSRILQNKVDEYIKDDEYLHELGMSATQVNANLVKGFLTTRIYMFPEDWEMRMNILRLMGS
jgi:uridylate kinase